MSKSEYKRLIAQVPELKDMQEENKCLREVLDDCMPFLEYMNKYYPALLLGLVTAKTVIERARASLLSEE